MRTLAILAILLFCGMAEANSQNYYYGSVKYYSADGVSSMGQTVSLVSRVVDPDKRQIVETVLQPKKNQSGADEFITELNLKTGNTFTTSDSAGTFSGEITFFGDEWKWSSWEYQVNLTSGGKISGIGFLTSEALLTNKTFRTENYEIKILEDLKSISQSEYLEIRRKLLGNRGL
jgi:hypothetical protein